MKFRRWLLLSGLKLRFGRAGMTVTDFRPHWDGDLVNLWVCIPVTTDASNVRKTAEMKLEMLLRFAYAYRWLFVRGDRLQLIVGIKEIPEQLLKAWIDTPLAGPVSHEQLRSVGRVHDFINDYVTDLSSA